MVDTAGKKVAIHVGAHKTATSLVQKYVRDRPKELEPFGLSYISRSDMNDYVGWGKHLETSPELLHQRVTEELSDRKVRIVFASHENTLGRPVIDGESGLYPRAHRNLTALKKALDGFDTTIVFSIRPQIDFLQSYYLQMIHEGKHVTFPDWMASLAIDSLSWKPIIEIISDVFGKENPILVDFLRIYDGQNEFLQDFFWRIDPGIRVKPQYKPVRNPSISAKGLQIALAANPYLSGRKERRAMRKFLQKHFSNRKYPRPVLVDEELSNKLSALYSSEYEDLTSGLPALSD
jgi:hypothetical protein